MANGTDLTTKTSIKDVLNITFLLWCWSMMVLAAGVVLGYNLH